MKNDDIKNFFIELPGQEATGKFISELRKEKGYSQETLSKRLYVSRKAVSKWENGNCYPSVDGFYALSRLFDITVEELLLGRRRLPGEPVTDFATINFIIKLLRRKKIQGIIIGCLALLIFCLSVFYFENYNATKIYGVWFEDDGIYIKNGMIVTTRSNSYFNFGYFKSDLVDLDESKDVELVLMYKGGHQYFDLLKLTTKTPKYFEKTGYNELSEINIKNKLDNLYMKVRYYNNLGEIIEKKVKLKYKLYYQSNDYNIFVKNKKENINVERYPELKTSNLDYLNSSDYETINLDYLYGLSEAERNTMFNGKQIEIGDEKFKLDYLNNVLKIHNDKRVLIIDFNEKNFKYRKSNDINNNLNLSIIDKKLMIDKNNIYKKDIKEILEYIK